MNIHNINPIVYFGDKTNFKININNFIADAKKNDSKYISTDNFGKYLSSGSLSDVYLYRNGQKFDTNGIIFKGLVIKRKKINKWNKYSGKISVTNNGLYCIDKLLPEAIINLTLSQLFINGITPHIIVSFGYSTIKSVECILLEHVSYIIKAEKIIELTTVDELLSYWVSQTIVPSEETIDAILIGIIHTSMVTFDTYKLIKNDYNRSNLFIQGFNDDTVYYQGKSGKNIRYFNYILPNGSSLYIRNPGFLIKLADFGGSGININGNNIFAENTSFKKIERMQKKFFPNYPVTNGKYLMDYAKLFKIIAGRVGIKMSKLFTYLFLNAPVISDPYSYVRTPDREDNNSDDWLFKSISPSELFSFEIFDKYRNRPEDIDINNNNMIFIGGSPKSLV